MKLLITPLLFISLSCFGYVNSVSPCYTSIFSFGDSFADTGNLVVLATPVLKEILIAMPPYGMTYFHHPTGRCSDGRLVLDFIAEEFGLPFVPPYLAHNSSFDQGANFAVAGATALDFAFFIQNNLSNSFMFNSSLNVQLGWFEELKPSLCNSSQDCRDYFSKSLFIVGEFGANDYTFMMFGGKSLAQVRKYVPMVIKTISNATERLIEQGAETVVIPGIWPDGCTPANLAQNTSRNQADYEPQTGCLKDLNELSIFHNLKLREAVEQLKEKYPHVKLINAEYYSPIIEFVKSPQHFGFIKTPLRVCCGTGDNKYNFSQSEVCGTPGVSACNDPFTYVNWDGVHLTEAAYHYIASGWLKGPYADPPILNK